MIPIALFILSLVLLIIQFFLRTGWIPGAAYAPLSQYDLYRADQAWGHPRLTVIVTLAVLFAALFIILTDIYDDSKEKWAFGALGMVLGYVFKQRPSDVFAPYPEESARTDVEDVHDKSD